MFIVEDYVTVFDFAEIVNESGNPEGEKIHPGDGAEFDVSSIYESFRFDIEYAVSSDETFLLDLMVENVPIPRDFSEEPTSGITFHFVDAHSFRNDVFLPTVCGDAFFEAAGTKRVQR
jgi:hypothetical protein